MNVGSRFSQVGFTGTRVGRGEKINGVKRHILADSTLVDSTGTLVAALVTPADMQDRAAFPALLRRAKRVALTISLTAHAGFLVLSQIALLLRRLDRSQSFDTL
ncbi:MAG: transposase [Mycobacterium sp.]